jgi:hypothetical protein
LFKSFSNVLTDRLPKGSGARTLREWKSAQVEDMAVDSEEPSTMELDNENQIPQNRFRGLSLSYQGYILNNYQNTSCGKLLFLCINFGFLISSTVSQMVGRKMLLIM